MVVYKWGGLLLRFEYPMSSVHHHPLLLSDTTKADDMTDDIYVVGTSWLGLDDQSPLQLDEAVFECCSAALKNAGVKRHQVGLTVISSLDLYDARSISNALQAPAAAAYLGEELRVEGDASAAFLIGAAGLASGQTEMALIVAINAPEIGSTDERDIRRIRDQVSSYTFDAHIDRPVGMTSTATLGLQASVQADVDWDDLAAKTADEITRGAGRPRGWRTAADQSDVRNAPMAAAPLTELMLPAESSGVTAVVIAAGVTGRRCPRPQARLRGWGTATGPATSNPDWLNSPNATAARAAADAYRRANITDTSVIAGVEMSDLSPTLSSGLLESLQLSHLTPQQVNPSGGVRSNFPGIGNGLLRIVEAAEALSTGEFDGVAVVHSSDDLMGLVSSTESVLVLEAQ